MDGNAAFRRAMHIVSPVFLSFYLLPEDLRPGSGVTRTSVTLLFLGTAACIEIARIALGVRLFGMRPYEGQRVSAYAQGALGLGLALFLFGDLLGGRAPYFVVPVFLGMAWIDPSRRSPGDAHGLGPWSSLCILCSSSRRNTRCSGLARGAGSSYSQCSRPGPP